ncbi:MAG: restriction endonuclease subunit S [Candidatus Omnitrophica bacterium]|nr:restriction endonuclease subunit S [Candidatus Omnitrophota bacterium]
MKSYSAYKDSGIEWAGKIPEGWDIRKLKHYFAFEKGKNAQMYTNEYVGANPGEHPVYSGQTEDEGVMGRIASFDYDTGEVLFSTTVGAKAMTTRMISGRFSLSQNCAVFIPRKRINVRYCKYFIDRLFDYEKGMISLIMQPSLRFEDLIKYKILVPPSDEIDMIAGFLDAKAKQIDDLIAKKGRIIELLKEERAAVINQAVTKGLDPNVEMKDSGIEWLGEIPEHWVIKRLKYVGRAIIGLTYDPGDVAPSGTLVLRSSNVQDGQITLDDNVYVNRAIDNELMVKAGDILLCSRNGSRALIGKCAQINKGQEGGSFGAFMTVFRGGSNRFILYVFKSTIFSFHIGSFLTSTINQLTTENLNSIVFALPPNGEWEAIADYLDVKTKSIDAQILREQRLVDLLKEYRTTLISEAVTGKIDVRGN